MSFKADFGEEHSEQGSNRVLRDTISTLTSHLASLGKPGTEVGDRAASYITLAGGNKGAVMKAADSLQEMLQKVVGDEKVSAWTNSNYQSVNNSIMIDGECHAEDPGVHIEIMDFLEDIDEEDVDHQEKIKKGKKKLDNKKDKKEDTADDDDDDYDRDDEKEGKKVKDKKKEKTKETDEDEENDNNEKEGKKVKDKKREKKEKK